MAANSSSQERACASQKYDFAWHYRTAVTHKMGIYIRSCCTIEWACPVRGLHQVFCLVLLGIVLALVLFLIVSLLIASFFVSSF